MGSFNSSNSVHEQVDTSPTLTEDLMDDYLQLSFLSRKEILRIHKRMRNLGDIGDEFNVEQRIRWENVLEVFPEIKANPFVDRLCTVFSSQNDGNMSFEDMIDLFSALSPTCPKECKAKWAFRIFDFNDSNALEEEDLCELINRLTNGKCHKKDGEKNLSQEEQDHIIEIIMTAIDLDFTGSIVTVEFVHAVSKMPDFCSSFTLKL